MTQKDFLAAVANQNIAPEVVAYAKEHYERLAEKVEAKKAKNEPIREGIRNILSDGKAHNSRELAATLDTSVSKITALCLGMVERGEITKSKVMVDGTILTEYLAV